jgi:multicomponent Na+:H+ antiporter subunit E
MIKNRILLFMLGFLLWLLLNWSFGPEDLIIALLVGTLVAWFTADIFPKESHIFREPGRYLWMFYYIPLFVWECFKANLDGAYRILHPDLPLRPGIVKVKTTLTSDTGITFLANTLTLKPGTMTVDVDRGGGFLYVHCVDVKNMDTQKATEEVVSKFERILKRIFE